MVMNYLQIFTFGGPAQSWSPANSKLSHEQCIGLRVPTSVSKGVVCTRSKGLDTPEELQILMNEWIRSYWGGHWLWANSGLMHTNRLPRFLNSGLGSIEMVNWSRLRGLQEAVPCLTVAGTTPLLFFYCLMDNWYFRLHHTVETFSSSAGW